MSSSFFIPYSFKPNDKLTVEPKVLPTFNKEKVGYNYMPSRPKLFGRYDKEALFYDPAMTQHLAIFNPKVYNNL